MSEKNYEPGTVAAATIEGDEGVRVIRYEDGWAAGTGWYADSEVTDVRPLVVLDLHEANPIARDGLVLAHLLETLRRSEYLGNEAIADQIEAQAKPPRIPEPGLWGVVQGEDGDQYVREDETSVWRWNPLGSSKNVKWDEIKNPVLIREGL